MKKEKQGVHLSLFVHIAFDPSSSVMLHHHLMGLKDLDKAKAEEGKLQTRLKDLPQKTPLVRESRIPNKAMHKKYIHNNIRKYRMDNC